LRDWGLCWKILELCVIAPIQLLKNAGAYET
jgi:hypothetical protein